MDNDCVYDYDCRHCLVGKPRDIFASVENLMPVTFTGARFQLVYKLGAPILSVDHAAPCNFEPNTHWWSAASVFKVNTDGPKPGYFWASAAYDVRFPNCCTSTMVELNPGLGNWNFEAVSRFGHDVNLDVALAGQMCAWTTPKTVRFDVDYKYRGATISASGDPVLKQCSIQYLKVIKVKIKRGGV